MSATREPPPGFVGTGWSFPPDFAPGGREVATVEGVEDIEQSLLILLSTRRGERPMQEGFGCALDEFLFEEMDHALVSRIETAIHNAVLYYEPRIELSDVEATPDPLWDGVLRIRLDYRVLQTNTRYNMVFPFYLNEAGMPGP